MKFVGVTQRLVYDKKTKSFKDALDKDYENKIELILDSSNYILSNNSINITKIIEDEVNKIKIETSFEKY